MEELSYSDWNLNYGNTFEIKQVYEGSGLKMTNDEMTKTTDNKDIIDDYFERKAAGDPDIKKAGEDSERVFKNLIEGIAITHARMKRRERWKSRIDRVKGLFTEARIEIILTLLFILGFLVGFGILAARLL